MKRPILFVILFLFSCVVPARADVALADAHAPIGVMGDHAHKTREWMFSYRYMQMKMDTLKKGKKTLSASDVTSVSGENYLVTPTQMDMEMNMVSGMYASSDHLTYMVMLPYVHKAMDHQRRDGTTFRRSTEGIGDLRVSALFLLYKEDKRRLLWTMGLSVPTGSTNEKYNGSRLAYAMQLGSGTYDVYPGLIFSDGCA